MAAMQVITARAGWVSDSLTQQYSKLLEAGFRTSTQPNRAIYE